LDVFQEAEMLRKVPMFGGFSAAELKLLAFTSRLLKFAPGDILMQRGDPADCAYVILEGEAEVIGKTSAGEFVVAVTGVNACVGEMGVLTDAPRSATVRARGPVTALRITAEVFLRLASENPAGALHVMRQLSSRLASETRANEALREQLHGAEALAGRRAP
jgi:CRP/FNR family transcriptional regulator, cyclic AMP receptor protein